MKKYLIIALSLLVVLLGAVACEKQGGEEEELPDASAKAYSCFDNENGIKWTISFLDKSTCEIYAKTSKGSLRKSKTCSYSNKTYKFGFPFEIPADKSASGKDEKYYFMNGSLKGGRIIIEIKRYNEDGSIGPAKQYTFN